MKKNVGANDKLIRVLIAFILVLLYVMQLVTGPLGIASLAIAGIMLITSLFSICPLYSIFGVNTTK